MKTISIVGCSFLFALLSGSSASAAVDVGAGTVTVVSTPQGKAYDYCVKNLPSAAGDRLRNIAAQSRTYEEFIHRLMGTCAEEKHALIDLEVSAGRTPEEAKLKIDKIEEAAETMLRYEGLAAWMNLQISNHGK